MGTQIDRTAGIDLQYKPSSYFWAKKSGIHLLSDIKGSQRRKIYARALAQGNTEQIDAMISEHALSSNDRSSLGSIHPGFMGGEYLPSTQKQEVEIARIAIASTTGDVTCIYARSGGGRIHYRVVDEYGGDTLDGNPTRTSLKPLSLKELVDFFLRTWDLITCLDVNFEDHGHPRERVKGFITDASSSFYAEFGKLVDARVDEWLDTLPPLETDVDDEEE